MPKGMLTMLGAYQGTGKSYRTMDLARIVLHGSTWPDRQPTQHDAAGARVVYVDAEGIPQVNSARATAMARTPSACTCSRLMWANCSI